MQTGDRKQSGQIGLFTLAVFISACLVFSVQPLFAKLTLPLLGGASNVWNTAMVFFQAVLLAGYIYAHVLTRYLPVKAQFMVHLCLLAWGFFFLPLAVAQGWTPPDDGSLTFWLLALFGISIGVPFFVLSANAPLLQRWYSYTGVEDADNPYFLYAASNVGSLLALCSYPLLVEPAMRLQDQTRYWSWIYVAFMVCVAALAYRAWIKDWIKPKGTSENTSEKITGARRVSWVVLAFVPSSLMLGLTSHMTNNVAAAPLLWVFPLALYLLTFVIVFARKPILSLEKISPLAKAAIVMAFIAGFILKQWVLISFGFSLLAYFVIALVFHGHLVQRKPDVAGLTEFYIWMSVGGVLGGIFNALISPLVFNNVYEYILILAVALLALPEITQTSKEYMSRLGGYLLAATLILAIYLISGWVGMSHQIRIGILVLCILIAAGVFNKTTIKSLIDGLALIVLTLFVLGSDGNVIMQDRSFFGVMRVRQVPSELGIVHKFAHGDTVHNVQYQAADLRRIPLAYYGHGNSFDRALQLARENQKDLNVLMIGLGAGAMACYEQAEDNWTYFEIDPKVVSMARDPKYFSFLSECAPDADIRIGDARLKIEDIKDGSQDFIIIDAFSSDSIPTHLVTREALALYRQKLRPDGLMFFHTSNRALDIHSVVENLARDAELSARHIYLTDFSEHPHKDFITSSSGVILGRGSDINRLTEGKSDWQTLSPNAYIGVWSDDYSNLLGTMFSKAHKDLIKPSTKQ